MNIKGGNIIRHAHFSLIELLVVISIIALLTSLLLPALKSARDTTKRIACVNSEKQLGITTSFYVSDYDGWYPFFWHPTVPTLSRLGLWAKKYIELDYLKSGRKDAYWADFDTNLHCPSRTPGPNCDTNSDYAMQTFTSNSIDLYGGGFRNAVYGQDGCKTTQVSHPSKLVSFCESWSQFKRSFDYNCLTVMELWDFPTDNPTQLPSTTMTPWQHQQGSNYLFCDGHVDYIKAIKINLSYFSIRQKLSGTRPDLSLMQ